MGSGNNSIILSDTVSEMVYIFYDATGNDKLESILIKNIESCPQIVDYPFLFLGDLETIWLNFRRRSNNCFEMLCGKMK